MFCDGAASRAAAARNWVKSVAWSMASTASMLRPGESATQLSATAYGSLLGSEAPAPTC